MNNPSVSEKSILVWDLPVRVFHWLAVLCFAGAWLTSESERWRLVHVTLGYTLGGLMAFRVVWGLVGTRHARFASFVRGPVAVLRYLKSLRLRAPEHYVGHNPAGAVAIVLLIVLGLGMLGTGWASYNEVAGEWVAELHEAIGNTMLLVVLGHLVGVVSGSLAHRENLVRAMVTGRKRGGSDAGIARGWTVVGLLLLAAVLGFWWLQWKSAPMAETAVAAICAVFA